MNKVEEAIEQWWGERCPEHEEGCPVCDAWREYDSLIAANKIGESDYNLLHYIMTCLQLDKYATLTSHFHAASLTHLAFKHGDLFYDAVDQLRKEIK